jgi:hypothetical protein
MVAKGIAAGAFVLLLAAGAATAAPPACPQGVTALSNADGSVTVSWDSVDGADGYNVFRQDPDGQMPFRGHVGADVSQITDPRTEPGLTYEFSVTATLGQEQSQDCPSVEVTAVPFVGTPLAVALALSGALVGYVALRRR